MRRFLFLLLILGTWYLAGLFRSPALLYLALTELLLFVGVFLILIITSLLLDVRFTAEGIGARKGRNVNVQVKVRNKGLLPSGRIEVICDKEDTSGRFSEPELRTLQTDGKEEMLLNYGVEAQSCGILQFRIRKVRIYDWLLLFHLGVRTKHNTEDVFVLPPFRRAQISFSASRLLTEEEEEQASRRYTPLSDRYELKEYQDGQPLRNINWNISARTDELWYRRYEEENLHIPAVSLCPIEEVPMDLRGIWYEVLYAIVTGLLDLHADVRIHPGSAAGRKNPVRIGNTEQLDRFMIRLYKEAKAAGVRRRPPSSLKTDEMSVGEFYFDRDLSLHYKGRLLFSFSREHYEEEISSRRIVV